MRPALESIAGIECLTVRGEGARTAVVLLHGYGASMHDLFPLWQMWHEEGLSWFFPNGILSLPMGHYEGRAWFSIDIGAMQRAILEGRERDLASAAPPELSQGLDHLERLLILIGEKFERVVLGGFSQGAMCASHLAMRDGPRLDGLVLLSGSLLARERFPKSARPLRFYQSHGSADPILPLSGALALHEQLRSLNFGGKMQVFNGGHEIPPVVVHEVKEFLAQFVK
jgi:phospholipase/carboxylesterase